MNLLSRRTFLGTAAACTVLSAIGRKAFANPLGLPLGIQLYSVRQQMADDLDAALAAVAAAGYVEVEAAALPKKSAKEIRASLDKAGLRCVSAHHAFADLHGHLEEVIAFDKELGVRFIVCSSPGHSSNPPADPRVFTLDDWRYTAEQLNILGGQMAAYGVRCGYHNHTPEFRATAGEVPYFELMRLTDPRKVTFEMDCGWVIVGGMSPVELMKKYPHRISMLHVKDFKAAAAAPGATGEPKVTELGLGTIDYRPIFATAARTQHIEHAFVEQEAFDIDWKESLKVDADYMRKL